MFWTRTGPGNAWKKPSLSVKMGAPLSYAILCESVPPVACQGRALKAQLLVLGRPVFLPPLFQKGGNFLVGVNEGADGHVVV